MTAITANGITIEYEEAGPRDAPAILLFRGLGTQLINWPRDFIDGLAGAGYRVVYHDNRDVGLSQKFDERGVPDIQAVMDAVGRGEKPDVPYTIDDMAMDGVGLLDALGIPSAHIVGMSLGGAIVQVFAARHPDRARSLTSIMSSSGNPDLPPPREEARQALMAGNERLASREAVIERAAKSSLITGSPGYPLTETEARAAAQASYDRAYHPEGRIRQMAASRASGDRRPLLRTITTPTLVIHGADDPLIPVEAGRDVAANIPDARLDVIPGMGHNIVKGLAPIIRDLILGHVRAADQAREAAE